MNDKVLHTLEYYKITKRLAEHAATSLGKAQAEALRPARALDDVKYRLADTDEAAIVYRLKGSPPMAGIRDVRAALRRAVIGGLLGAGELLDIATTAAGGRRLRRFLAAVNETNPLPQLQLRYEALAELKELEADITACIDEAGDILDSASPELARIRRERRTGEARVREKLDQLVRSSSSQKMLQDQLVTMRNDRYVIPVKQEYRASFGGIVHDQSGSGATLFIEPEAVVQLNNRLRELALAERKEIERILARLTARAAEHADELAANQELLAEIDFIFAKAALAHAMKASLPRMNDRGFIKLLKGRHPLLTGDAVPLQVELGNSFSAIIITGPNTGGKTVALKTIGLLSLMAMSGLFVPAEDGSQLCVFDAVYADIGDEQSIEQNLSTFSSHMTNIISILRDMSPKSLVLLDELGAGTDPAEGSALAIAILDLIHRTGCRMVATTHYSELKAYAYEHKGMINASMEFDIATLSPTYRLLIGVPGRSNAFAIAERLGLDKDVIRQAAGYVGEDDKRVESMIASLEEDRLTAESERKSAERLRHDWETAKQKLERQEEKLEKQKQAALDKAAQEARDIVAHARREAEHIIGELRKMALEQSGSIKEHRLIEAKKRLEDAAPAARLGEAAGRSSEGDEVQAGDEVHVSSVGQKGFVVELGDTEATVQLGILKLKVPLGDLRRIQPAKAQSKTKATPTVTRARETSARQELDLRGSNLEDSLLEVDRFIDEAFMSNLGQIYIIHGKGTGVLRAGIQDYLKRHRLVKQYRLGNHGEGGAGVTVVEL